MLLLCLQPLDTLMFYYNVSHRKVSATTSKENPSNTLLANDIRIAVKPLPKTSSAWAEVAIIKCMPSSFLRIANSENELNKVLSLSQKIRNLIALPGKQFAKSQARNYIIFMKTITSSLYDLVDTLLYTGFTDSRLLDQRVLGYFRHVQQIINGDLSFEQIPDDSHLHKDMYRSMVACWKAGSENFHQYLIKNRLLTQNEGLFIEHSKIVALKWLPINSNQNHGSTKCFKQILKNNNISQKDLTEMGIGETVAHHKRIEFDMHLASQWSSPVLIKLFVRHHQRLSHCCKFCFMLCYVFILHLPIIELFFTVPLEC